MNTDSERIFIKSAKLIGSGSLVFAAGLLTLMGCGRTVVDTTVEQQPTQIIETTIDEPVVDVPEVEPTTDVSDDTTVTEPEEETFEPSFVMNSENDYTMYIDCEDNTNDPKLQELKNNDDYSHFIGMTPNFFGFSSDVMYGVVANNGGIGVANPLGLNYEYFMDMPIESNMFIGTDYDGTQKVVISEYESSYGTGYVVVTPDMITSETPGVEAVEAACAVYRMCLDKANGNFACALEMYNKGLDTWNQAMQECMSATGLTEDEIYKSYMPDFVYAHSNVVVDDPNYYKAVLSYADNARLYRTIMNGPDDVYDTFCTVECSPSIDKSKTLGSR